MAAGGGATIEETLSRVPESLSRPRSLLPNLPRDRTPSCGFLATQAFSSRSVTVPGPRPRWGQHRPASLFWLGSCGEGGGVTP